MKRYRNQDIEDAFTSERKKPMSDWKSDLDKLFQEKAEEDKVNEEKLTRIKSEVSAFYSNIVTPAFEELKAQLEKHQREVLISIGDESAIIATKYNDELELDCSIKIRVSPGKAFPYTEIRYRDPTDCKPYKAEGHLRSGTQDYNVTQITQEEIIRHVISEYEIYMRSMQK